MIRLFFASLIWLLPLAAFAAKSAPQDVTIQIQHGELATQFKIDSATETLSMSNSQGLKKSRKIDKENLTYLISEASKLPTTKRLPQECLRASMGVRIGSGKTAKFKQSCFGMKAIHAKAYQDFANLLAVVI
jgi:hypothetical protein